MEQAKDRINKAMCIRVLCSGVWSSNFSSFEWILGQPRFSLRREVRRARVSNWIFEKLSQKSSKTLTMLKGSTSKKMKTGKVQINTQRANESCRYHPKKGKRDDNSRSSLRRDVPQHECVRAPFGHARQSTLRPRLRPVWQVRQWFYNTAARTCQKTRLKDALANVSCLVRKLRATACTRQGIV